MSVPYSADFRLCLVLYSIFAAVFCVSTGLERDLSYELNPGCPKERCNDSLVKVVHVSADGPNDTVHYVWCFHLKPTLLIALTSPGTNLSVTWEPFPDTINSIQFSHPPAYSFGVFVNKIFEFDDADDFGVMNTTNNNSSYIRRVEMPDTWTLVKPLELSRDSALLVMEGSWKKNGSFVKDGTLRVELETFRKEGHGPKLPHLLHSPNATQLEMSLFNMETNSSFQHRRFAMELVLAANESVNSNLVLNSFKSLDDEHTPGVFTLVNLETPASKQSGNGGYLQWRPVAYVSEERDIINSTDSTYYLVKNTSSVDCKGTLLEAFFGTELNTHLLNAVNISFGSKDDGFYSKSNISIWTATVGYGHPPTENFSLLVLLIMGFCLGLPAVIIVMSGLYVALRGITYRKDDLFLSE